MTIYILLIIYVILLAVTASYLVPNQDKRELLILRLGMLAIFLLLALKKETVGTDIIGYREQYELSAMASWSNITYVYFELGYIQLMKLFAKAGFDFQVFTIFVYAVSMGAYYKFIKRYSKNVTLSLLIFICYQFLVFYTSGLRQALAMAICIYAFLLLDGAWGKKWQRVLGAVLLVLLATLFHQSALLFLVMFPVVLFKSEQIHWVALAITLVVSVFVRSLVLQFIRNYIAYFNMSGGITLGGNFIFLVGLAVFCTLGCYQPKRMEDEMTRHFLPIAANAVLMAVIAQILFSGSTLLRSAMYLTLFLIPGLPCALKCFERKIEILLTFFLGVFLIVLFWTDTLSINQLKLCPYLFFWQ